MTHVSRQTTADNAGWRRVRVLVPLFATVLAVLLTAVPTTSAPRGPEVESPAPPQLGLRSVIIDPGHGGLASGASGQGGVNEKDVTLDIAVRLREIIYRRLGLQVFLTREADNDVPLDQRTEKANNWAGDLFISIHANGYRLRQVRGPETYFLSAAASDQIARETAGAENSADDPAGADGSEAEQAAPVDPSLEFILWDLAQTQHLRESSRLAEIVQGNLNILWQIRDRGVKQAPFRVLKGATMPAILVEVGYLSNDEDAALLTDDFFRQQIAEALFRSIASFREEYAALVGAAPEP